MKRARSMAGRLADSLSAASASPIGKAAVLVAVVVLTAGCSGVIGDDGQASPLDSVPDDVDGVVYAESEIATDDQTTELLDGVIEMQANESDADADVPETWEGVLEELNNETALDLAAFDSVTLFMQASDTTDDDSEEYGGAIVQSDWAWEDVTGVLDEENMSVDFEQREYEGVTVYVGTGDSADQDGSGDGPAGDQSMWVADFGDGTFALGTETVVKDVVDTREGDADSFGGDLRDAYEETTDGYFRAAFNVTEGQTDAVSDIAAEQAPMGGAIVPEASVMTMSYYTADGEMTLETDLRMESQEEASQFESLLDPFLDPETIDEAPDPAQEPFDWFVASTTVDQTDETVTITVAATPEDLLSVMAGLDTGESMDEFAFRGAEGTAAG